MVEVMLGSDEMATLLILHNDIYDIVNGDINEDVLEELKAEQENLWNIILKIEYERNKKSKGRALFSAERFVRQG